MIRIIFVCLSMLFSVSVPAQIENKVHTDAIDIILNQWHAAAAQANFEAYFGLMSDDAIFIGTDPTEKWTLPEFKAYSKPHFDKGKAWSFTTLQREIYPSPNYEIAWFDELLQTRMGICRGSGVLQKEHGRWRITHYVLSITIPNDQVEAVQQNKADFDQNFILKLEKNSH